jgi:hypothetical protein
LQGPVRRHHDVGPAPVVGLSVADATAIGKPVECRDGPVGRARGPWACERGRRHARSTIREPRNEGQTGDAPPPGTAKTHDPRRSRDKCKATRRLAEDLLAAQLSSAPPRL